MSTSIVCVWCHKPLLDADHAKKHASEQCTESPTFKMRLERDEAIDVLRRLEAECPADWPLSETRVDALEIIGRHATPIPDSIAAPAAQET